MSNHARSTKWWPKIASPIASRPAQTFSDSISKKSWSGRAEKTNDLRDRCCYHARVLWWLQRQGEHNVCLQTRKERHALALLLSSAWRPLPRRDFRGRDDAARRTSGGYD